MIRIRFAFAGSELSVIEGSRRKFLSNPGLTDQTLKGPG
jgi:hypothetical protein